MVQSHSPSRSLVSIPPAAHRDLADRVGAYIRLTKPRVVELLLVTTVPAMVLAAGGWPSTRLVVAVVVGGALAAGGANTINAWIERDRDRLMHRTESRPLPAGEIVPSHALTFGIVLNVVAFGLLWAEANLLAATLTMCATLFYVFVYTIWLKPRTVQNIVIGGAAGAVPVLVGWAAVEDALAPEAWVLFAVVFLWTPAHFWALAMRYRDDYERAGIPMLPVVRGAEVATRQIAGYATATAVASLVLALSDAVGTAYAVAATVLAVGFVGAALRLVRDPSGGRAIRFFTLSNLYLCLLFVALAVDTFVS
jgi:protoheme IX farnesyltransferase